MSNLQLSLPETQHKPTARTQTNMSQRWLLQTFWSDAIRRQGSTHPAIDAIPNVFDVDIGSDRELEWRPFCFVVT
jgi:hypothetical protein